MYLKKAIQVALLTLKGRGDIPVNTETADPQVFLGIGYLIGKGYVAYRGSPKGTDLQMFLLKQEGRDAQALGEFDE